MRHEHIIVGLALAWTLATAIGGCAAKDAPPARQPAALDVPIVYSSYFQPERLTEAQRGEINAVIADTKLKAGKPWFVYVRYSREGTYRVSAYFRPTRARSGV